MEHVREVFSYYVVIYAAVSIYKIIDLIATLDLKTTIIAVDTINELFVLVLLWLYGRKQKKYFAAIQMACLIFMDIQKVVSAFLQLEIEDLDDV